MSGAEVTIALEAGVALLELAGTIAPSIIAAIQSSGAYTPEQKAALVARVIAARQKVADYVPRDV